MKIKKIILDEIDSTNNYAKALGDYPADGVVVIRAIRQTCGRGRGGGAFFSDHRGGLWVSIVTPVGDIAKHFDHNRAISLAVLNALKSIGDGAPVKIKWPNDVYIGDRKVCGILLENIPDHPNMLIAGFGLNVNIPAKDFPEELRGIMTSVQAEAGRETPLDKLIDEIIAGYLRYRGGGPDAHKLYSDNLYGSGRHASVDNPQGTSAAGTFAGVEADGRLRLDTDHGTVLLPSGTLRFEG